MAQKAPTFIPEGMQAITPQFWFNGNCRQAIDFYKKAFKAELIGDIAPSPDGKSVWHALMQIGDSKIMLADAMPNSWEKGPDGSTTIGIWLYTQDCDALFNNAVSNGCEALMPPVDAFWGDRMGKVKDPYGHCWAIATRQWIYTPEEMQQRLQEMMAGLS